MQNNLKKISEKSISKVILSGEHAVVYGTPAIALPIFDINSEVSLYSHFDNDLIQINAKQIDKTFYLNPKDDKKNYHPIERTVLNLLKQFKITHSKGIVLDINSNIPIASGMGSGASVTTSIIKVLSKFYEINLTKEDLFQFVYEIEKIYHGKPSGIDPKVIVYEKPVYFEKNKKIEFLDINTKFALIILDSEIKSLTKDVVDMVAQEREFNLKKYNNIFQKMGEITEKIKLSLLINDLENIGNLLDENHKYLQKINVSNPVLDDLVLKLKNAGCLGSKLSGAGKGGIVIGIVNIENLENTINNLKNFGITNLKFSIIDN